MKKVTYTSKDNKVRFTWEESSASFSFYGDAKYNWGHPRASTFPSLQVFEQVAENFIKDYEALIDRIHVKYPLNFIDNEYRNLHPEDEAR